MEKRREQDRRRRAANPDRLRQGVPEELWPVYDMAIKFRDKKREFLNGPPAPAKTTAKTTAKKTVARRRQSGQGKTSTGKSG